MSRPDSELRGQLQLVTGGTQRALKCEIDRNQSTAAVQRAESNTGASVLRALAHLKLYAQAELCI